MEIIKFKIFDLLKINKIYNFIFLVLFISLAIPQTTFAKISDKYAVQTFWQEAPVMPGAAKYFIRTEVIEKKTNTLNNHPIKIPSNVLRKMFSQLSYKYNREQPAISLFSNLELSLLSKYASQALERAKPNEDVTFVIKGPHVSTRWSFQEDRLNAGRIFVSNNQLNMILGAIQVNLQPTLPERYQGNVWETTGIIYDTGHRKKVAKYEGLVLVYDEKKKGVYRKSAKRKDWFIFTKLAYQRAIGENNNTKGMSDREYQDLQKQIDVLQRKIGNDRPSPPPKQRNIQTPNNESKSNLKANKSSKKNNAMILEQRLKTIDNLFKKGILSEEEYKKKRQEILSGI